MDGGIKLRREGNEKEGSMGEMKACLKQQKKSLKQKRG